MPFKSKAQARFLYAKHPEVAKEFESHTKSIKALPEHASAKDRKHMLKALKKKHK